MSNYLNIIKALSCFIFGFILAWNINCSPKCQDAEIVRGKDTSYTIYKDTGTHSIKDTGSYHIQNMSEIIPANVDTIAILKNYYRVALYTRHFNNDSLEATIIDSISQNKIIGTSWLKYKWLIPCKTTETIDQQLEPLKNKVFIGLQLKGSANSFGTIPSIMLVTKSDKAFCGGYDIFNKEIFIGAYFKLHF